MRDQPAHRKGRTDADGEHAKRGGCGDLRSERGQRIEDRRQPVLIGAAGGGERELVGLALEQRHAEPLLEQMHHAADRGRRDMELLSCSGKAAAARRRLECLDAVEKEQPPQVSSPSGKLMLRAR